MERKRWDPCSAIEAENRSTQRAYVMLRPKTDTRTSDLSASQRKHVCI